MKTKIIKLENGGIVIYRKNKRLSQTVANIGFRINNIKPKNYGVAHFLEHMLFKGTKTKNSEQFFEISNEICPRLNASTALNLLQISFNRTNKMIDKTFDLVSDMILNTRLDEKDIENEKGVILKEAKLARDKNEANLNIINKTTIANNKSFLSYTEEKNLGNEDEIKNMSKKKLQSYKDNLFTQNNFICSITSSLSKRRILKLIKNKIYNKLPIHSNDKEKIEWIANKKSQVCIVSHTRENKFGFILTFVLEKDFFKERDNWNYSYASNILRKKIHFLLREKGLVYTSGVSFVSERSQFFFYITVQTAKENFNESLAIVCNIIKDLQKNNVSQEMIEHTKNNFIYIEDETQPTPHTKTNLNRLHSYLHYEQFFKYKRRNTLKQIKSCDAESIRKIYNEFFSTDKIYMTILGKDLDKKDYPNIKQLKKMIQD